MASTTNERGEGGARVHVIDVEHLGAPEIIACALLETETGAAIVDPGPASTVDTLISKLTERGVGVADLEAVFLTHIHLDHAGATGQLVDMNPGLVVYVHERGAPHLADPTRLLKSATRLYGAEMKRLWGTVRPVPAHHIRPLVGGERLRQGSLRLEVAYTPGHASHHVSYLDPSSGLVFAGDVAGCRLPGTSVAFPPTPPPDIDLSRWEDSLDQLLAWRPERLLLTHFGLVEGVRAHIASLRERLGRMAEEVRASLSDEGDDATRAMRFETSLQRELVELTGPRCAAALEQGAPARLCWQGLARYWRRQAAAR